jgi:cytosine deaminase
MDLIVRDVQLSGRRDGAVDVGVEGGTIVAVEPRVEARANEELDGAGGLIAPSFVDSHSHLDKAMTVYSSPPPVSGTLAESFERARVAKRNSSVADVIDRAATAVHAAIANGTGAIRAHCEVDSAWGLTGFEGLL